MTAPLVYFFVVLPTETYNLVGLRHKNEQYIHSDGLFVFLLRMKSFKCIFRNMQLSFACSLWYNCVAKSIFIGSAQKFKNYYTFFHLHRIK